MQIKSKFTVAVHILCCIEVFGPAQKVTSDFLSKSTGVNSVIIRNVIAMLKSAGFVSISQGVSGITLSKKLSEITFYDVYKATDCVDETGLFHFHEKPSELCPVGRNIHKAMDSKLQQIQNSMEAEMKQIFISDVAEDIEKEMR